MFIPWFMPETSLDDFVDENQETRVSQLMEDASSTRPEDDLYRQELVARARRALKSLPERERLILINRFGLAEKDEKTLEQIGKLLGLSRERVRQLEKEALSKLRRQLSPIGLSRHRSPLTSSD